MYWNSPVKLHSGRARHCERDIEGKVLKSARQKTLTDDRDMDPSLTGEKVKTMNM